MGWRKGPNGSLVTLTTTKGNEKVLLRYKILRGTVCSFAMNSITRERRTVFVWDKRWRND